MNINRPFEDCKTDELHFADAIQSFGALVALDEDDTIVAVSANSETFLDAAPQDLLGTDAHQSLPSALDVEALRREARANLPFDEALSVSPMRPHLRALGIGSRPVYVAAHLRNEHAIIELESASTGDVAHDASPEVVQRLSDRVAAARTANDAASVLVHTIAELTGFARVMAYRFLPDWHGEVVDEHLAPGLDGFRGLRFPASDIPANARKLYLAKRQRIIADVAAETVPVFGAKEGMTLDLLGSELRAVHPIHIEYLKNMGVAASFSVSIVVEGRLWGMIACHHLEPRRLGLATRQACELAATIASLQIANLESVEDLRTTQRYATAFDRAWHHLDRSGATRLEDVIPDLRDAFEADGVLSRVQDRTHRDGDVPTGHGEKRLRAWVDAWPNDEVTASSRVPDGLADDSEVVRAASGILHVPLGTTGYVTFLRREEVETVEWAGRPPHATDTDGDLTPRTSFGIWREATRGQARRWRDADIEAGERLRDTLVKQLEHAELERRASTDVVTGLPNRALFESTLAASLEEASDRTAAVLMIDLDSFKEINDTFGHPAGDDLLKWVAERLRGSIRGGEVASRFGGDEFAVLIRNVTDRDEIAAAASRVVQSVGTAYRLGDRRIDVQASVGAARIRSEGDTTKAVMARADEALYQAKRAGGDRYVIAEDDGA